MTITIDENGERFWASVKDGFWCFPASSPRVEVNRPPLPGMRPVWLPYRDWVEGKPAEFFVGPSLESQRKIRGHLSVLSGLGFCRNTSPLYARLANERDEGDRLLDFPYTKCFVAAGMRLWVRGAEHWMSFNCPRYLYSRDTILAKIYRGGS